MSNESEQIQELIEALGLSAPDALDRLLSICYQELKRLASRRLNRERDVTLDTTSLVHELYLKLSAHKRLNVSNYEHFLGLCGQAMRQIMIDHLRSRTAIKRGGDALVDVSMDPDEAQGDERDLDRALMMAEALENLERIDPRMSRVLECRFFAGMTDQETARALDTPLRTVQRDWARARAWLNEIGPSHD